MSKLVDEVHIRPVTEADIDTLWHDMRPVDRDEMRHWYGGMERRILDYTVHLSIEANAGYIGDDLVAMFGIGARNALCGIAVPWLVGTTYMDRIASERAARGARARFLRESLEQVRIWAREWPIMENHVWEQNRLAVRWLRWLGFTIEPAEPWGMTGELFHRFHMKGGL